MKIKDKADKLAKIILTPANTVNPAIVGQPAYKIAELAGFSVPKDSKVLISEETSTAIENPFAHEKLSPVLAMYWAENFDDAIKKAEQDIKKGDNLEKNYCTLGKCYLKKKDVNKAIANFEESIKQNKDGKAFDAKYQLAGLYSRVKQFVKAYKLFKF